MIIKIDIFLSIETTTTTNPPPNNGDKDCPETNPDQSVYVCPTAFRRDPSDCNLFYQCTQDDDSQDMSIAKFSCPENTVYSEKECKCVKPKPEDNCQNDSARSLKYLIQPRNLVRKPSKVHAISFSYNNNKILIGIIT